MNANVEQIIKDWPKEPQASAKRLIGEYGDPQEFTPSYDGSVMAERTKGEISARCGGTSMNFVAINLAHDIVTGKRRVREARDEYTRLFLAYKRGEKPAYTRAFQFPLPKGDTKDLDTPTT